MPYMQAPGDVFASMNLRDLVTHINHTEVMRHNAPTSQTSKATYGGNQNDIVKYQFWPGGMAMGSLVGRQFIQMLGSRCEYGEDVSRRGQAGFREGLGKSYLAFDFQRETLVIKANYILPRESLPPALRPLDAELAFDDIASQGIHIVKTERKATRTAPNGNGHMNGYANGNRHFANGSNKHNIFQDRQDVEYDVTVTVSCRRPPKFYTEFEQSDALLGNGRRSRVPFRRRATAMDFAVSGLTERDAGPVQAIPEGPCAYPTFWNTYRWVFVLTPEHHARLVMCTQKFQNLAHDDPEMNLLAKDKPEWHIMKLDPPSFQKMYGSVNLDKIRFPSRTLIEGLISHGIIKPGDVKALLQALHQHAVAPAFQDRLLARLYSEERIRNISTVVRNRATQIRNDEPPCPDHLVMIRTVQVTPTRVILNPPQQEPSNSVTRRYADKIDGIIRVQFSDEEDRLHVQDYTKQADSLRPDIGIMARIRRALQHGIIVGGRRFTPVASSASQQKEHALWFIDSSLIDGLELRAWMGNVAETIVAKHAARMGLPFSTSRIVNLNIKLGERIPDVERNDHCFTDGVGVAGTEVMREAARALGTTKGINATPSAIQFRLGGAKGMLTCWPALADKHEVRLRPSLIKFESKLSDLNVVRLAKYQTAFLNRQFIMIMCANGVPEDLMIQLFTDAVENIKGLAGRVRKGANHITKDDYRLMSTCSDFPLSVLIKAGFNKDPLLIDICEIIECRALQDLKWRARIKLSGGVFLIGVADESGTLNEGEIFCQFQESDDVEPRVVMQEVLICRAPALHPGDIRRAWCVDCKELRHLKNVIVFSVKGTRPLPNMLGGGDLDGDDFTLIWDPRFVQALKVYTPMDYTAPPPERVPRVTQEHLNDNFVKYILNDLLGQVDNAHLTLSDYCDRGPFDPDCLLLSETHSIAVDFAKTGIPAEMDPRIRPKISPDFMDKVRSMYDSQRGAHLSIFQNQDGMKRYYVSEKILGRLFRIVQPEPYFRACDLKRLGYPTDRRISEYPIYSSLIGKLKPIKKDYENKLSYDMRRYRVSEPEIPSGIGLKNKRRKARDQNLNEPLHDSYQALVAAARGAAREAIANISFTGTLNEMQTVARHAYALTFEREYVLEWEEQSTREAREHGADEEEKEVLRSRPLTSFAWAFLPELVEIAALELL